MPATRICPVRLDFPLYFRTEYITVPDPVPVAPDVMSIQPPVEVAAQAHPAAMETLTCPSPPSAPTLTAVGLTDGTHVTTGTG
jgi:hypothetical protein